MRDNDFDLIQEVRMLVPRLSQEHCRALQRFHCGLLKATDEAGLSLFQVRHIKLVASPQEEVPKQQGRGT